MTAPSSIGVQLMLGMVVPTPAPLSVTEKLDSVEITRTADGPSSFQLRFRADRTRTLARDFAILDGGLLKPWNRVVVSVSLGGLPVTLIDGFITRQDLSHDRQFSASTLTVSGEDVSILMDRLQVSIDYPQMGDSMIAYAVLAKYAVIGVQPEVIPTEADLIPTLLQRVPQQNATDRAYLVQLAAAYGYGFHVRPGPIPLTNIAYWGPPPRTGDVKPALTIDSGPATNVDKIDFQLDSLAPLQLFGLVQDTATEDVLPLATLISTRLPPFATDPGFNPAGLLQRRDIFTDPRYGYGQAYVDAQASTDVSTDDVVTVRGELDTERYGAILDVPGLVDVRGAGQSYDGRYLVREVTHAIRRGRYRQSFRLTREGTGSTVARVAA